METGLRGPQGEATQSQGGKDIETAEGEVQPSLAEHKETSTCTVEEGHSNLTNDVSSKKRKQTDSEDLNDGDTAFKKLKSEDNLEDTNSSEEEEDDDSDMDLAVILRGYPLAKLTDSQSETLEGALIEKINPDDGGEQVQFVELKSEDGALIFTCGNEETKAWLKEAAPTVSPWEGAKFKVKSASKVRALKIAGDKASKKLRIADALPNDSEPIESEGEIDTSMLIAVVLQGYPLFKLTKPQAETLEAAILERLNADDSGEKVQFLATKNEDGALIFDCADEKTKAWLRENAPNITPWEGATLEVEPASLVRGKKLVVFVSNLMKKRTTAEILDLLEKQNKGVSTKEWKLVERKEFDKKSSLLLWLDDKSVDQLKSRRFMYHLGLGRALFRRHKNVPNVEKTAESPESQTDVKDATKVSNDTTKVAKVTKTGPKTKLVSPESTSQAKSVSSKPPQPVKAQEKTQNLKQPQAPKFKVPNKVLPPQVQRFIRPHPPPFLGPRFMPPFQGQRFMPPIPPFQGQGFMPPIPPFQDPRFMQPNQPQLDPRIMIQPNQLQFQNQRFMQPNQSQFQDPRFIQANQPSIQNQRFIQPFQTPFQAANQVQQQRPKIINPWAEGVTLPNSAQTQQPQVMVYAVPNQPQRPEPFVVRGSDVPQPGIILTQAVQPQGNAFVVSSMPPPQENRIIAATSQENRIIAATSQENRIIAATPQVREPVVIVQAAPVQTRDERYVVAGGARQDATFISRNEPTTRESFVENGPRPLRDTRFVDDVLSHSRDQRLADLGREKNLNNSGRLQSREDEYMDIDSRRLQLREDRFVDSGRLQSRDDRFVDSGRLQSRDDRFGDSGRVLSRDDRFGDSGRVLSRDDRFGDSGRVLSRDDKFMDSGRLQSQDDRFGDTGRLQSRDDRFVDSSHLQSRHARLMESVSLQSRDDRFVDSGRLSSRDDRFVDSGRLSSRDDRFVDSGRLSSRDDRFVDSGRLSSRDDRFVDSGRLSSREDRFVDSGRLSSRDDRFVDSGRRDDRFLDSDSLQSRGSRVVDSGPPPLLGKKLFDPTPRKDQKSKSSDRSKLHGVWVPVSNLKQARDPGISKPQKTNIQQGSIFTRR